MPRTSAQEIRQQHLNLAIRYGQDKVRLAAAMVTAQGWLTRRRIRADYDSAHQAQTRHISFLIQAGVAAETITAALRANSALEGMPAQTKRTTELKPRDRVRREATGAVLTILRVDNVGPDGMVGVRYARPNGQRGGLIVRPDHAWLIATATDA